MRCGSSKAAGYLIVIGSGPRAGAFQAAKLKKTVLVDGARAAFVCTPEQFRRKRCAKEIVDVLEDAANACE